MKPDESVVTMTRGELRELILEAVAEVVGGQPEPQPLLDQAGLAKVLSVNPRTVYSLRRQGLPQILVGESPRFELAEVLAWLRERGGNP